MFMNDIMIPKPKGIEKLAKFQKMIFITFSLQHLTIAASIRMNLMTLKPNKTTLQINVKRRSIILTEHLFLALGIILYLYSLP